MAELISKYNIGDKVWHASTVTTRKQHPCPDCLGAKVWKAVSPAGSEYEFACPRCSSGYHHNRELSLAYEAFAPSATCLTIGSIRINTEAGSYDAGVSYMCLETGVGSGSIYGEGRLFETQEEAFKAAETMAALQNSETKWVVDRFNQSLSISDYQLHNATVKLAEDAKSRASSMLWNIGSLLEKIVEADDLEQAKDAAEEYRNYDWSRDKEKLSEAAA